MHSSISRIINRSSTRSGRQPSRDSSELRRRIFRPLTALVLAAAGLLTGCTPPGEYFRNGFKVGPNYGRPPVPVARDWIDANDANVRRSEEEQIRWWTLLHDPALDALICTAYRQNLTLREAGFRVLEARAQLGIDTGNLFPQTQTATGSFSRSLASRKNQVGGGNVIVLPGKRTSNQWNTSVNMAWELDFWGRFRRAIESDEATLDASVELYDAALLTLEGDIATNYVQMRTTELRIKYAIENVKAQQDTLEIVRARVPARATDLELSQALSTLAATEAAIPELEIALRQSITQLCILLGMPPEELRARLGPAPIPTAPQEVVLGIPADLIRRRPDVRAAERQLAAQSAQIGIAEAEFYPAISITGSYGYSAATLGHLFEPQATTGVVGPSFRWNILNYGRLLNGVRLQDAKFQELLATYQNSVLTANQDVENGLITFLRGHLRVKLQRDAVEASRKAVEIALIQYTTGRVDFTTVTQVQITLVQQEDVLAQAEGEIVLGLIQVYRALGGGWQIRLTGCDTTLGPPSGPAPPHWQPAAEPIESQAPANGRPESIQPIPAPIPEVPARPMNR
jgi:NodT family efflux transporter outer membrane factor (OMF) lipoprotein